MKLYQISVRLSKNYLWQHYNFNNLSSFILQNYEHFLCSIEDDRRDDSPRNRFWAILKCNAVIPLLQLNCSSSIKQAKIMQTIKEIFFPILGCPGAKKNEFLTSVLDALSTDMVHAVSDPAVSSSRWVVLSTKGWTFPPFRKTYAGFCCQRNYFYFCGVYQHFLAD